MKRQILLVVLTLLTGCGYHLGNQALRKVEISVPYVEGDLDGTFTSALVHEIATRSSLSYTSCGGDLCLRICLLEPEEDNIGFRYAPGKKKEPTRILTATEARITLRAKVSLTDRKTGRVILGPNCVFSSLDLDFESDFSKTDFHSFSLGQLEMYNQASDNAYHRLNERLAQKIVDYVEGSW